MNETLVDLASSLRSLDDEQLAHVARSIHDEAVRARARDQLCQAELIRRAEELGARVIGGIRITPGTPTYDIGRLLPLKEHLSPKEWGMLVSHEITLRSSAMTPTAWEDALDLAEASRAPIRTKADGRHANKLIREHGERSEIGQIILAAKLPGIPKVEFEEEEAQ